MLHGRELSDPTLQLDSLDGLRGFAVLIVFLSHTSNTGIYLLPFANFSGNGKSGVFLFFVLSSFLLTLPFLRKGVGATNKHFLFNYLGRRFFRVYPLYLIYLLLGLITTLVLWKIIKSAIPIGVPFTLSIKDFFKHLLLIQGQGVTWSISVEFRYYFILPILALTYSVVLRNKLLPSIILTIGLILLSQFIWPQSKSMANDLRLWPYLPIFFMGSLLAVIYHNWQNSKLCTRTSAFIIEVVGILAMLALIYMIPSVSSYCLQKEIPPNYYHKQFILFGVLWSIVVFACLAGFGALKRIFETPLLRYLGFISFSVYLLHIIVVEGLERLGSEIPVRGWIMLLVTVAISHISWTLIEKPTSKIKALNKLPKPECRQ